MPNTGEEAIVAPSPPMAEVAPNSNSNNNNDNNNSGGNNDGNNNTATGTSNGGSGAAPMKKMTRARGAGRPASKRSVVLAKNHPTYESMIRAALLAQQDKKSSSRVAILKYIMQNYQVGENANLVNARLRQGLKRGVASGLLKQVNGTGATGSFRLADTKPEAVKAVKKQTAKKAAPIPAPVTAEVEPPILKKVVQNKATKKITKKKKKIKKKSEVPKKMQSKKIKPKKANETAAATKGNVTRKMHPKGKKVGA